MNSGVVSFFYTIGLGAFVITFERQTHVKTFNLHTIWSLGAPANPIVLVF
jgi:hypothetical protein